MKDDSTVADARDAVKAARERLKQARHNLAEANAALVKAKEADLLSAVDKVMTWCRQKEDVPEIDREEHGGDDGRE